NGIDAARHPEADDGGRADGNPAPVAEAARWQHPPEPILPAAQQLFEIGRLRPAPARAAAIAAVAAAPRSAAARTGAPWATALTLPEHRPRTFPRRRASAALAMAAVSQASARNRAAGANR